MARPLCPRRVAGCPGAPLFKPAGIPARMLEEVVMTLDEFEAIRLADLEGLYQEDAAQQMGISRTTFGRILDSGHRKVAEVLHGGKCLRLRSRPEVSETSRDRTGGERAVPEGRKSDEDLRTRRP